MPILVHTQDMWQMMTAEDYRRMKPGPEKLKWLQQVEDHGWFYKSTYTDLTGNLTETPPIDLSPYVDDKGETVFLVTEVDPEFPGGQAVFMDYLQNTWPDLLVKPGESVQKNIRILFSVEKDGSITEVELANEDKQWYSAELLQSCIQTIQDMPNWSPGMYHGKAVKVKMLFMFSLRV